MSQEWVRVVVINQGGGGTWIPNTGWEGGGPARGRKKNSAHDLFLSQTVNDGRTISFFEFSHRWQLDVALNLPDSEHLTASKWQTAFWRRNLPTLACTIFFLLYIISGRDLWARVSTVTALVNLDDCPTTLQNANLVSHWTMKKCIGWVYILFFLTKVTRWVYYFALF